MTTIEKIQKAAEGLKFVKEVTDLGTVYGHKFKFISANGEEIYQTIFSYYPGKIDGRMSIEALRKLIYDSFISIQQSEINLLSVKLFIEQKRNEGWRINLSSCKQYYNAWKNGIHTGGRTYLNDLQQKLQ